MIQEISDKLLSLFQQFEGSWQPFVAVYDYHRPRSTGFPFLTFEPATFTTEIADTCYNYVDYVFEIFIIQDIQKLDDGTGRKVAKESLTKSVEEVKDILGEKYTLDNTTTRVMPTNCAFETVNIDWGDSLVASLTVNIRTIEFISS